MTVEARGDAHHQNKNPGHELTHNPHPHTVMSTLLVPVLVGTLALTAAVVPALTSLNDAPATGHQEDGFGTYVVKLDPEVRQPTVSVRRQHRPAPAPAPLPAPSPPAEHDAG